MSQSSSLARVGARPEAIPEATTAGKGRALAALASDAWVEFLSSLAVALAPLGLLLVVIALTVVAAINAAPGGAVDVTPYRDVLVIACIACFGFCAFGASRSIRYWRRWRELARALAVSLAAAHE